MKIMQILLVFVLAALSAEADSSSSSASSTAVCAGDIEDIANAQNPVASASTFIETYATTGAIAVAMAISEAAVANDAGDIIKDSSKSNSISFNGQTLNGLIVATDTDTSIEDKIKEEIEKGCK